MTALRSLHPVAASAAILPNHCLRFNVPGTALVEPSWASVEPIAGGVVPQSTSTISSISGTGTGTGTMNSTGNIRNQQQQNSIQQENQPSHVHGVLYKLTEEDFLRVCNTEGVPLAYTVHRCRVVPYSGDAKKAGYDALLDQIVTPAPAPVPSNDNDNENDNDNAIRDDGGEMPLAKSLFAYTMRASRKDWRQGNDIPPSRAYLNVLIRGAHEFQLDDDYVQYLEGIVPGNTIGNGMAEMMLEAAERRAAAAAV